MQWDRKGMAAEDALRISTIFVDSSEEYCLFTFSCQSCIFSKPQHYVAQRHKCSNSLYSLFFFPRLFWLSSSEKCVPAREVRRRVSIEPDSFADLFEYWELENCALNFLLCAELFSTGRILLQNCAKDPVKRLSHF